MNSEMRQHSSLFIDTLFPNIHDKSSQHCLWLCFLPKVFHTFSDLSFINNPLPLSFKAFQRLLFHQFHRHPDPQF